MRIIESVLNKELKKDILFWLFLPLVGSLLAIIITYLDEGHIGSSWIFSIVIVSMWLITIPLQFIGQKLLYNRLYRHKKYVYFMTNNGIYNGWNHCTNVHKYRIPEKEQKISLYITQTIFQKGLGPKGAGKTVRITEWNDFSYNEKDKASIFRILFHWEKEMKDFKADSFQDERSLHKYIKELEMNNDQGSSTCP